METRHKWVVATYILSYIVPSLVIYFAIQLIDALYEKNLVSFQLGEQFGLILATAIGSFISLLVTIWLMRPEIQRALQPLRNFFSEETFTWGVGGGLLLVFVQYISTTIERLIGIPSESANTNAITSMVESFPLLVLFPVLYAPFLEEIVFRKFLFGNMKKRTGAVTAALVSGLIFGIIHWDFPHLLTYTSMGVTLAFLYHRTSKIYIPMIAHGILNALVILTQLVLMKM